MEGNEDIVKAAANRKKETLAVTPPVVVEESGVNIQPTISTSYTDVMDGIISPDADDDGEFYDAVEFSMRFSAEETRSNLIEQRFGFATPPTAEVIVAPEKAREPSPEASVGACPESVCRDAIKESLVGYPGLKELRTVLPLDPNVSSKPTLNVWSFLKSAIGKDLSKGILSTLNLSHTTCFLQRTTIYASKNG